MGTPTRVFLRACAINNREWARGCNPAWVRPYERRQTIDFQDFATFTLCKSETLRVYAHTRVGGCASESVGGCVTPSQNPNFLRKLPLTHGLPPTPTFAPSVLLCAHNACVVVPECQRVASRAPSHAQVRHTFRPCAVLCVRLSLVRETACETCERHASGCAYGYVRSCVWTHNVCAHLCPLAIVLAHNAPNCVRMRPQVCQYACPSAHVSPSCVGTHPLAHGSARTQGNSRWTRQDSRTLFLLRIMLAETGEETGT